MGKYRLKSRNKDSVITLMEVDTECRAWYIKTDQKEAAIKTLQEMREEITSIESIYINGDEVTDEVFSHIAMNQSINQDPGPASYEGMGGEEIPLPEDE